MFETAIAGLQYVPDYITPDEHDTLIQQVDAQIWITDLKRRVQHYGYRYDYRARRVDESMFLGSLPVWLASLAKELHEDGFIAETPDQVIINEYMPGQGIAAHVDCEPCFGDTILSLTLGSSCAMGFSHLERNEKQEFLLMPCSLVVMRGESRYGWKHGIPGRKTDLWQGTTVERGRRISLTFRQVILG